MISRDFIQRKAAVMSRALDELMPTFECRNGKTRSLGELPSEAEVLQFLNLLDDVFYPGHRTRWDRDETVSTLVVERLDEAHGHPLPAGEAGAPAAGGEQYPHLREVAAQNNQNDATLSAAAERVVGSFFSGRRTSARCCWMYSPPTMAIRLPTATARSSSVTPASGAITVHRMAHELYLLNVPLIPR